MERKASFIAQVTKGRLDAREIDDLGGDALSYAEVKALASGDPLLLEKATVDAEVGQLERLRRAHDRGQAMLRHRVHTTTATLSALNTEVPPLRAAIERRVSTKGDAFTATINGARHTERAPAAAALGTRPTEPARAQHWDAVVSMVDAYRSTYAITDPARALGPTPDPASERAAAHRSITREWAVATSPAGKPSADDVLADTDAPAIPPMLGHSDADTPDAGPARRVDVDGLTDNSGYGYGQSYTDRHRADPPSFKAGY